MRSLAGVLVFSVALIGPTMSATPYDGLYRGTYTWAGNGNAPCPRGGDMSIRVTDGKFPFGSLDGSERVIATVGADGSFSAVSGQRSLQGKIQGEQFTATLAAPRCNYLWSLKK